MNIIQVFIVVATCSWFATIRAAGPQRAFSEEYVEGLYGRIFELTERGNSNPCPHVIDHFKKGKSSGTSWLVQHSYIVMNGAPCRDRGVLALDSFDSSSQMPAGIQSSKIAEETFELMKKESTGFWLGKDARTCGKWKFPFPTFLFFVKEFDRKLKTSFNVELQENKKYMFVVAPSFTCIYTDVPRRKPTPPVVINGPHGTNNTGSAIAGREKKPTNTPSSNGTGNSNGSEQKPTSSTTSNTSSDTDGEQSNSNSSPDTGEPSKKPEQGVTIVDVANGATPPSPSPHATSASGLTIIDVADGSSNSSDDEIVLGESTSEIEIEEANTGESLCFPSNATVELSNGHVIRMDQLSIGDTVRVGAQSFSRVFTFTHRTPKPIVSFIHLTSKDNEISLTEGHYLYVNGNLMQARNVAVGDNISLANGDKAIVTNVAKRVAGGLYNPQTLHGDIVVNGILTSTYTTAVEPPIAHALLTPMRALWEFCKFDIFQFTLPSSEDLSGVVGLLKTFVEPFHLLLGSVNVTRQL